MSSNARRALRYCALLHNSKGISDRDLVCLAFYHQYFIHGLQQFTVAYFASFLPITFVTCPTTQFLSSSEKGRVFPSISSSNLDFSFNRIIFHIICGTLCDHLYGLLICLGFRFAKDRACIENWNAPRSYDYFLVFMNAWIRMH